MGPHFFKCGKIRDGWRITLNLWSFNGAALFQVRKVGLWRRLVWLADVASMGPHFFKCGKGNVEEYVPESVRRFNGAALFQVRKAMRTTTANTAKAMLQWGRTFSSAERFDSAEEARSYAETASMGPHFFKCGKNGSRSDTASPSNGFNGAALFQVRKDPVEMGVDPTQTKASMGPHFFKCGKRKVQVNCNKNGVVLQWGRTFSSAESSGDVFFHFFPKISFNGAALFQVRKVPISWIVSYLRI